MSKKTSNPSPSISPHITVTIIAMELNTIPMIPNIFPATINPVPVYTPGFSLMYFLLLPHKETPVMDKTRPTSRIPLNKKPRREHTNPAMDFGTFEVVSETEITSAFADTDVPHFGQNTESSEITVPHFLQYILVKFLF